MFYSAVFFPNGLENVLTTAYLCASTNKKINTSVASSSTTHPFFSSCVSPFDCVVNFMKENISWYRFSWGKWYCIQQQYMNCRNVCWVPQESHWTKYRWEFHLQTLIMNPEMPEQIFRFWVRRYMLKLYIYFTHSNPHSDTKLKIDFTLDSILPPATVVAGK